MVANKIAKKHGIKLIVQKRDGQEIRGELIAVKHNSLLLLTCPPSMYHHHGEISDFLDLTPLYELAP